MTEITTTLPRALESVRAARQLVAEHATGLTAQRRHDATVLVSELVTNALCHGRGVISLRIVHEPTALLIEVADEGHGKAEMSPTPGLSGGWGLRVIDELATTWGCQAGSTRVWVRLHLDEPPTGQRSPAEGDCA